MYSAKHSRWLVLSALLAACASAPSDTQPPTPDAAALPKQLATVELSPTPNESERAATQAVRRLTEPPPPTAAVSPTPTVYIGVFIGGELGDAPVIDLSRYATTLTAAGGFVPAPTPACLIPIDPNFGDRWRADPSLETALGCPTEPPAAYIGTTQLFERGVMYSVPTGEIYTIAFAPTGGRFWYVPQAPPDQGWIVPAPDGLRVPLFGFGAVWKAVDGVRAAVGFARLEEAAASLTVQRFDRGALLRDVSSGQVFVLIGSGSGEAYGPF
jgi:hypothetical protein